MNAFIKFGLITVASLLHTSPAHSYEPPPRWTVTFNEFADNLACIQDGPTNIRTSPDLQPGSIRATLQTASCGRVVGTEGEFVLIEFYVDQFDQMRRYWVHQSQL